MVAAPDIATAAIGATLINDDASKEKSTDLEKSDDSSVAVAEVQDNEVVSDYPQEDYKRLKRKIDKYLLPLMWLCYGIQQTDKTSLGTQATFGLRADTHLKGQQYSWLTTAFYLTYMCFEFPSNILLQRYMIGRTLSVQCCISPGFILVIGSWYTTREHASRSLVFQSVNAGFGIIASLILYGIGSVQYHRPDFEAWRYMSYEKKMANVRIRSNNTDNDKTGIKKWSWEQVRECLLDPCFWFSGINAFLSSVPNGGLTTFGGIITTSFGFTNLQVILLDIPRSVFSVCYFIVIGLATSRWKDLRMYFMAFSVIPPFVGFLVMSQLPDEKSYRCYFMSVPFVIALFLSWTLISSNVAGRTKRTLTSSFTFVGYCVGNMVGSQIFKSSDAFLLIVTWRIVLVMRNRRRDKNILELGISAEERIERGKVLGEQDITDFKSPFFRYTL
ncbi:vitamin h [Grosmannia clavigera kw1407]|uniref:Vitamin h n=1 Tax=Grosmannia clavigera (strain kw1407 / UAMH 11150) TaxID=655863 RepID=F0XJC7_GROCL|nr:vitamin h [Grosmannia clavigera kw1407]EFX02432.1 vitamin h [Grosmannia clavigera kw1407]